MEQKILNRLIEESLVDNQILFGFHDAGINVDFEELYSVATQNSGLNPSKFAEALSLPDKDLVEVIVVLLGKLDGIPNNLFKTVDLFQSDLHPMVLQQIPYIREFALPFLESTKTWDGFRKYLLLSIGLISISPNSNQEIKDEAGQAFDSTPSLDQIHQKFQPYQAILKTDLFIQDVLVATILLKKYTELFELTQEEER
ncbi:MAG: hypothetical protein LBM27_03890 [Lactobacillaceae bacterium]|jgi:hypothetical protein|nr:hypothetical protein [Lactobacillaceae bacterium]